jgi:hypothetical protein
MTTETPVRAVADAVKDEAGKDARTLPDVGANRHSHTMTWMHG